jgi:flagellar biosynthesis/type III secretory pathway protein FliH
MASKDSDPWLDEDSEDDEPQQIRTKASGDDVWGDSDDDDSNTAGDAGDEGKGQEMVRPAQKDAMSAKDEEARRMKHYKDGFREAIGQAREDALQEGFGLGFKEAFAAGIRTGREVGFSAAKKALSGLCEGEHDQTGESAA